MTEPKLTATAILAGGCFWCTEAAFEQLSGVLDVESGYIGGDPNQADYKSVCTGQTGHADRICRAAFFGTGTCHCPAACEFGPSTSFDGRSN